MNKQGKVFASATLFDSGSELAKSFLEKIELDEIRDFDSLPVIFGIDYAGVEIGELDLSGSRTVYCSDSAAGFDSSMATVSVDNWVTGGINANAFVEDSLESGLAQKQSGWALSLKSSQEDWKAKSNLG